MKKTDKLDALLYQYMPAVDHALICELEYQVDENFTFSDEFEEKMERLIRKNAWYSKIRKCIQYTAAVFIVSIALCIAFSDTVRAKGSIMVERIKTVLEDSFLYTYFVNENDEKAVLTEPAYVPAKFECINLMENDTMCYAVYEDDQGNQITYQQMLAVDGMEIALDTEYVYEKTRTLNEREVSLYFYEDGLIHIFYSDDNYIFEITSEGISEEEAYQMLEDTVQKAAIAIICSSPKASSNPGDYIKAHQSEYDKLMNGGESTLCYCIAEFMKGKQTDLRGQIMALACEELLQSKGKTPLDAAEASDGQEWFDTILAHGSHMVEPYLSPSDHEIVFGEETNAAPNPNAEDIIKLQEQRNLWAVMDRITEKSDERKFHYRFVG